MNIAVLVSMVPDLVEDLEIDASGVALDPQWLRYVLSESDDHALEQALLLKDRHGAKVVALALDRADAEDALYTALARGADEAAKITGIPAQGLGKRATAAVFRTVLQEIPTDLVLTGVQAIDDLDGHLSGLLGGLMDVPYVGVTRSVDLGPSGTIVVQKEYPGGLGAELEVALPAVIGVLSAPQPPRYVPIARIRDVKKTRAITERPAPAVEAPAEPVIRKLFKPQPAERARMIEGPPEELARQIVAIFEDRGLMR